MHLPVSTLLLMFYNVCSHFDDVVSDWTQLPIPVASGCVATTGRRSKWATEVGSKGCWVSSDLFSHPAIFFSPENQGMLAHCKGITVYCFIMDFRQFGKIGSHDTEESEKSHRE